MEKLFSSKNKTKTIAMMGLFTAIVFVLQLLGSQIRFGTFSISLVLVPIVIGGALYGVAAAAWLGLVFAAATFISGDAALFLGINVFGTILVVVVKDVACGVVSALAYRAIVKKNPKLAGAVAGVLCPIVNTGIFIIGCRIFFNHLYGGFVNIITACVGLNFVVELIINIVLSPVIIFLIKYQKKVH